MATLQQQPPNLDVAGCGGSPFTFTVNVTPKDDDGNVIPWDDFVITDAAVIVYANHAAAASDLLPTVTNPSNGVFVVSWSGGATLLLINSLFNWALQATVNGVGPFSFMAGHVEMADPTQWGQSVAALTIDGAPVGDDTVDLVVTLGAPGAGGGDVSAEITRAEAAEAALGTEITAETTRAEAAEATNATAIATETTRAETAEALKASATALTAEVSRAEAAEAVLASDIAGLGGGGSGAASVLEFDIAYTDTTPITAALYTPTIGDVIYDWWVEIDTAWDGNFPHFDLGTFAIGGNGLLVAAGIPSVPLSTASAALGSEAGLKAATGLYSWAAAVANAGVLNVYGVPISPQLTVTAADPIYACISQDGTNLTPVHATVLAATAPPSLPLVVTTGSTDQFAYVGSPEGGAPPEMFTMAASGGGGYNLTALIAAMAAATGSVSGERFDSIVTPSNDSGSILLTMVASGAAANGNAIQPATHDVSANMGFGNPSIFGGGEGGSPGSTQGALKLYILTFTPS